MRPSLTHPHAGASERGSERSTHAPWRGASRYTSTCWLDVLDGRPLSGSFASSYVSEPDERSERTSASSSDIVAAR